MTWHGNSWILFDDAAQVIIMVVNQLLLKQHIERIAIVRALPGLENLMCIIPALRALRAAFPHAHITLIGLFSPEIIKQRWRHLIDDFIEFPGYPGIPESPSVHKIPEFLAKVQALQFDLALQMHDNGTIINSFTSLLGARINAGFYMSGYYCPDPTHFIHYPDNQPEIWRHLKLMKFLGIPVKDDELEFPLLQTDFIELSKIEVTNYLPPDKYVCIDLDNFQRHLSAENLAKIAEAITERSYQVVLTGSAEQTNLAATVASLSSISSVNLVGKISIGALSALLVNTSLLICNNIFVSYLAAALHTKSIVILDGEVERWAPQDRQLHRILSSDYKIITEWIGFNSEGNLRQMSAKLAVTPAMVMTQVDALLSSKF
ncbi:glycosyltransferase family 9 protein [Dulcicalothrix desertica]|nr:glycosyltransferase family 9 protein [Dulcicalothrix desertica]TWH43211.1 ADP-heptose:LPS heptosyltransferase [Dulcicalothrix desertica PCC 7102]